MPRIVRLLAATVLSMPVALLAATPAHADVTLATCGPPSSQTSTYDPPLTKVAKPTTIEVSTKLGPCVAPNAGVTSGSSHLIVTSPAYSCFSLLESGPLAITITWNTGQTSTLSGNFMASVVGAAVIGSGTGTVTTGLFAEATFVLTREVIATDILLCTLGIGTVSESPGELQLTITSV